MLVTSNQHAKAFCFIAKLYNFYLLMDQLIRPETPGHRFEHVRARRNTSAGISTFFKNSLGNAFLSFYEQTVKVRPSIKQNEQIIKSNYKKINKIIDSLDENIKKRMQNYEAYVFEAVRGQIQEMKAQSERLVAQLNQKIVQKNVNSELWQVNNELDYFKIQTFKLFQENKHYRLEIKLLQKTIKDLELDIYCQDLALQKLRKKYLKEKGKTEKEQQSIPRKHSDRKNYAETHGFVYSQRDVPTSLIQLDKHNVTQDKDVFSPAAGINIGKQKTHSLTAVLLESQQTSKHRKISILGSQRSSMRSHELPEVSSEIKSKQGPQSVNNQKFKHTAAQDNPFSVLKHKMPETIAIETNAGVRQDDGAIIDHKPHQRSCQKQTRFVNRFNLKKTSYQKQKQLQHSMMRHYQHKKMITEIQTHEHGSIHHVSSHLSKEQF